MLGRAQRRGARIVEFPVTWDDVPGSTFRPARHGAVAFWELALIARRLAAGAATPTVSPPLPGAAPPALAPAVEAVT